MPSWRYPDGYGPNALWAMLDPWLPRNNKEQRPFGAVISGLRVDTAFTLAGGVAAEGDEFSPREKEFDFGILEEVLAKPPMICDFKALYERLGINGNYSIGGSQFYAGRVLLRVVGFMRHALGVEEVRAYLPAESERLSLPLAFMARQESGASCWGFAMGLRNLGEDEYAEELDDLFRPDLDEFEIERRKFYAEVGDG